MRYIGNTLIFSPSDLSTYAESEFASWMDRCDKDSPGHFQKDPIDEMHSLLQNKGHCHEAKVLDSFRLQGLKIIDLSSKTPAHTWKAMQSGPDLIYQAPMSQGRFAGIADFLIRVPGDSKLGDYHYQVWDSKLARRTKSYFLIQLSAYAEMLEFLQGIRPESMGIILGDNTHETFRTNDYYFYYQVLKRSFLEFQDRFSLDSIPDPAMSSSLGRWSTAAQKILIEKDSIFQVARVTRNQIKRLAATDVHTMAQLSRMNFVSVKGIGPDVLQRLIKQASLQISSRGKVIPDFELTTNVDIPLANLPSSDPGDIYFDLEGFPLAKDGLEYLWGYVYLEKDKPLFDCIWAHDPVQEQEALIRFVEFVHDRWLKFPAMHIYHYASYETRVLTSLAQRYGCCEDKIDDLLRNEVFVDLYQIVRGSFIIGVDSYSIKAVEHLYRPHRMTEVASAATSVVFYQNWLDAMDQNPSLADKILEDIRKYNEDDCQSTYELYLWLRKQMDAHDLTPYPVKETIAPRPPDASLQDLIDGLGKLGSVGVLLGQLVAYHQREMRREWWAYFARFDMSPEELFDDADCIAKLCHNGQPAEKIKKSLEYTYTYDPNQDIKAQVDDSFCLRHDSKISVTITFLDPNQGFVKFKTTALEPLPINLELLPKKPRANLFEKVVREYAEAYRLDQKHKALDDFLHRRQPRLKPSVCLPQSEAETTVEAIVRVISGMDESSLVIQGPPGAGKTYVGAQAIADLCRAGKRVGIMSNSHKAIDNLLIEATRFLSQGSFGQRIIKVGQPLSIMGIEAVESGSKLTDFDSVALVGGTVWAFSNEHFKEQFDYLFMDEASQVSLANLVAVAAAARNLVFLGDQMQLAQPAKGSHPGESGLSCLDYYLKDQPTIHLQQGIFLPVTRRLHPDICRFISDTVYEGRLTHHPSTSQRVLVPNGQEIYVRSQSGIHFVPVVHEGNRQSSEEEAEVVQKIVAELLAMNFQEGEKAARSLEKSDILIVAPYNLHARLLQKVLGDDFRIASVDKFQGQEAPVVILSLGASTTQDAPRGVEFIFDRHRLNVALSRAMSLAIVLGSPALAQHFVSDPRQMSLVNFYCRIILNNEHSVSSEPKAA